MSCTFPLCPHVPLGAEIPGMQPTWPLGPSLTLSRMGSDSAGGDLGTRITVPPLFPQGVQEVCVVEGVGGHLAGARPCPHRAGGWVGLPGAGLMLQNHPGAAVFVKDSTWPL